MTGDRILDALVENRLRDEAARRGPFSTFAPFMAPRNLDDVRAWFAYMADHSAVPHPDDSANEHGGIYWSTADLRALFNDEAARIRYDRAMDGAHKVANAAGVDIYALAAEADGLGDCTCGHPLDRHQTGVGPWTGFCYGILADLGSEYVTAGADPNEPCACESPTPERIA